jgi:hypothetical protein
MEKRRTLERENKGNITTPTLKASEFLGSEGDALLDERFDTLVRTIKKKLKLLGTGPPPVPWNGKPTVAAVTKAIKEGYLKLPILYQKVYADPLIKNLPSIIKQAPEELESLAGAIYCHKPPKSRTSKNGDTRNSDKDFAGSLNGFLAVISNTYRSFLDNGRRERAHFPPVDYYPPLAMFRHETDVLKNQIAPYIKTRDVVEKLTDAKVGVVGLPSVYRDHPLMWGGIAHEVAGHELLNANARVLSELQAGIRLLFDVGPVPSGDLTLAQLKGLLWQYWAEEAASEVCAVLNLGPTYGLALAAYYAALTKCIVEYKQKRGFPSGPNNTPIRTWSGTRIDREFFTTTNEDVLKALATRQLDDLNPHPVEILVLHVVIGAIESLSRLSKETRDYYIGKLEDLADICAGKETHIDIAGYIQTSEDTWMRVDTNALPLKSMQESARRVGAYIATAKLQANNWHSFQELETWDEGDEQVALEIAESIRDTFSIGSPSPNINDMGDDAQLISGSYMAFHLLPEQYDNISASLKKALENSYARDPYWGASPGHYIFKWDSEFAPPEAYGGAKVRPSHSRKDDEGSERSLNYRDRLHL